MQSNCTFPVSVLLAFAGNKNKNLKENLILIEKKKKAMLWTYPYL